MAGDLIDSARRVYTYGNVSKSMWPGIEAFYDGIGANPIDLATYDHELLAECESIMDML